MNRTVITYVGMSALSCSALELNASFDLKELQDDLRYDRFRADTRDLCERDLVAGLAKTWSPQKTFTLTQRCNQSPAEIASLSLLKRDADSQVNDRVVLLYSATAGGRFCGPLLGKILSSPDISKETGYPWLSPKQVPAPVEIVGLRVTDDSSADIDSKSSVATFVRRGLVSYVRSVWEEYNRRAAKGGRLIINMTSGYKGIVPIARDLVLLLKEHHRQAYPKVDLSIDLCYLFQGSSELIYYQALPILFDWNQVPKRQLDDAARPSGVEARLIAAEHRGLFAALAGQTERLCRSPVGEVVWALSECITHGTVSVPSVDFS